MTAQTNPEPQPMQPCPGPSLGSPIIRNERAPSTLKSGINRGPSSHGVYEGRPFGDSAGEQKQGRTESPPRRRPLARMTIRAGSRRKRRLLRRKCAAWSWHVWSRSTSAGHASMTLGRATRAGPEYLLTDGEDIKLECAFPPDRSQFKNCCHIVAGEWTHYLVADSQTESA